MLLCAISAVTTHQIDRTSPTGRVNRPNNIANPPPTSTTQDPSRFHHWQALLDEHRLRSCRPEQLDRTADEEQKAQQYAPEEHRRILWSLHFSYLLSVSWRPLY